MAVPKITLSLSAPPKTYEWLSKRAEDNGRSRNAEMNIILKEKIEEEQSSQK